MLDKLYSWFIVVGVYGAASGKYESFTYQHQISMCFPFKIHYLR